MQNNLNLAQRLLGTLRFGPDKVQVFPQWASQPQIPQAQQPTPFPQAAPTPVGQPLSLAPPNPGPTIFAGPGQGNWTADDMNRWWNMAQGSSY